MLGSSGNPDSFLPWTHWRGVLKGLQLKQINTCFCTLRLFCLRGRSKDHFKNCRKILPAAQNERCGGGETGKCPGPQVHWTW